MVTKRHTSLKVSSEIQQGDWLTEHLKSLFYSGTLKYNVRLKLVTALFVVAFALSLCKHEDPFKATYLQTEMCQYFYQLL